MKIIDYLPYYLGCDVITTDDNETAELVGLADDDAHLVHKGTGIYGTCAAEGVKPVLRRLEDMTEKEMIALLQSTVPSDMESKPSDDEYIINMFYADGGNLVDERVAVGAEVSLRCFSGQIALWKCGTIYLYDDAGDEQFRVNDPKAFHYLLTQHFDLFGLIDAGLAVDAKTIQ